MATGKFVTYCRVSTERQGRSGLGLEAQRSAVTTFLNGGRWSVVGEFVEVESGAKDDRPQLAAALALCRVHGAVLLLAKIDRLSRDLHFLTGLQKAGVRFVAADMPEANETMVGFMAIMAQAERKAIGARTKAALAEAKKRGVVMGGFRGYVPSDGDRKVALQARQARAAARGADLAPIVADMQAKGTTSLNGLAKALTEAGIPTARGASTWSPMQVSRLLATFAE
jgi:DNA invertase Pin-like site-specific DNA recombinase